MLRGIKYFIYHDCAKKFITLDMEWGAIVNSCPQ